MCKSVSAASGGCSPRTMEEGSEKLYEANKQRRCPSSASIQLYGILCGAMVCYVVSVVGVISLVATVATAVFDRLSTE